MRSLLIAATLAAGLVGIAAGAQAAPVSNAQSGLSTVDNGIVSVRMSPRKRMMMRHRPMMRHGRPHHR